jgi:hypothetical protein
MKTLRLFTIILLAVLVFSTWAPVYAKPVDTSTTNSVDLAGVKLARLRVTNRTGGTLYVSFSGPRSYSFAASSQGKTTFAAVIMPGKYSITVRTSACRGELHFKRNVKGGTVGLPPVLCRRK